MADVTIAQLTPVVNLQSNAFFPVSQGGTTYSATISQLTQANTLSAEALLVGGGASGGYWYYGGGGGGGGVLFLQNVLFLKGCSFNIGVGKGGTPVGNGSYINTAANIQTGGRGGIDGTPSSIIGTGLDLIAYGGGGGGGDSSNGDTTSSNARAGGSGGGGSMYAYSLRPGQGIPGQGYPGGIGSNYPVIGTSGGGGGGGGAGGVGGNASTSKGGNGGPGIQYSITGSSFYYGAGGGGGAYNTATGGDGGTGGGGNGANYQSFNNGNATGIGAGGGGGSYNENNYNPGSGSNGTVIIAYPGAQKATGGTVSTVSRSGYTVHTFSYPGGTFTPNF